MEMHRLKNKVEQVADYLRENMTAGRWGTRIPGRITLARELGINEKTVEEALRQLEQQKFLIPQGVGKRRKISITKAERSASLRIALLNYEPETRGQNYIVDLVHQLADTGHTVFSTGKTLMELDMDVGRIAKLVDETQADAWIIVGGSRHVLEWFVEHSIPAFALFGRRRSLTIAGAGPAKPTAMIDLTKRLIQLGHRKIVLLVREERRLPKPGATESAFLKTLEANGIQPSSYHLPGWSESPDGFQKCLEELFRVTPPTALIVDESPFFVAAMQFFIKRGIRVPEAVSLACCDSDPNFSWCMPPITHIDWDSRPILKRIVNWASNISRGKIDHQQLETKAQFVEGGTIGPVLG
jgi:DNA-binding LacI/PurR family transcriptional regulator/DNA-binding transcriptional regulator YhcF (GntR family)